MITPTDQIRMHRILSGTERPPAGCQSRSQYAGNYSRYLYGFFKQPTHTREKS